jgi:hypothetical protein
MYDWGQFHLKKALATNRDVIEPSKMHSGKGLCKPIIHSFASQQSN